MLPLENRSRAGRWGGPLLGVVALVLAGAGFALVIYRQEHAWQRSFAHVLAEPPTAPSSGSPPAVDTSPGGAPWTLEAPSAPAAEAVSPVPAAVPVPSMIEAPPAALARMPPPIVLHVEPPTDSAVLDARAAGTPVPSAAPAPAAAPASAAPTASSSAATPLASSAPVASASAPPPPPRYSMFPESVSCGRNTCNVGEVCCNASCGTCVRPGAACDAERRCAGEVTYPESQSCGLQTCNVGLVCCNPSCGICAEPGEACSDLICS